MDRPPRLDAHVQIVPQPAATPKRAVAVGLNAAVDSRLARGDATWGESSFDLAQGLDVKEMESKLSRETLDTLFRR